MLTSLDQVWRLNGGGAGTHRKRELVGYVIVLCVAFSCLLGVTLAQDDTPSGRGRYDPLVGNAILVPEDEPKISREAVPWSVVRATIDAELSFSERGMLKLAAQPRTPREVPPRIVRDAVRAALVEAWPAIESLIAMSALARSVFEAPPESIDDATKRSQIVGDPTFERLVLPRVTAHLRACGITCDECPMPAPHVARVVPWGTVREYLLNLVSVADETAGPVPDSEARPTSYALKLCGGGGAESAVGRDAVVAALAFVTAFRIVPVAAEMLQEQSEQWVGGRALAADKRASYMTARLRERLADDGRVLEVACEVFAQYGQDLGLVMTECSQH